MAAQPTLRATLLPVLLLATGSVSQCELSTDSGTGELHLSGRVRFLETGAGCWQLETQGGRYELDPAQAPAVVLQDGARVRLTAQPRMDADGACESAMPVRVRRVEEVLPP